MRKPWDAAFMKRYRAALREIEEQRAAMWEAGLMFAWPGYGWTGMEDPVPLCHDGRDY